MQTVRSLRENLQGRLRMGGDAEVGMRGVGDGGGRDGGRERRSCRSLESNIFMQVVGLQSSYTSFS